VVRINDRGPFVSGRIIDLTPAGAHALGFSGLAHVTLDVVSRG
jgi:rare lipoprotein A